MSIPRAPPVRLKQSAPDRVRDIHEEERHMSPKEFNLLAGDRETSSTSSSWLTKIVIDQLDEGTLLSMIDHAIGKHNTFLYEARAIRGIAITQDRTLYGNPDCGPDDRDRVYAAFDELKMLRNVRERLVRKISGATMDPYADP